MNKKKKTTQANLTYLPHDLLISLLGERKAFQEKRSGRRRDAFKTRAWIMKGKALVCTISKQMRARIVRTRDLVDDVILSRHEHG